MRLTLAVLLLASPLAAQAPDSIRRFPVVRSVTVDSTVVYRTRVDTLRDTLKTPPVDTTKPPPPPPPPPPTGKKFFTADAESGTTIPPWSGDAGNPWGVISDGQSPKPTNSTAKAHSGTHSFKFEAVGKLEGHYSQVLSGGPQTTMGDPGGRYRSGYYSFWAYIDAGYTAPGWNMLLGWMTGVSGAPSPISHVGLEVRNGVLQVVYVLKNCSVGLYVCPTIPGYQQSGGWYMMTAASPVGVKAFPRGQWVHLVFFYKMAAANGQVTVWQDGTKIMDLTAPTMNTFGGHSIDPLGNKTGDMIYQLGIYGGTHADVADRLYLDDLTVADYRLVP